MKTIPLTRGYVARVDDGDYVALAKYNWYASGSHPNVYAARRAPAEKRQLMVYMHRVIAGNPMSPLRVDHRDRDRMNNTRDNLRVCTPVQNSANRSKTHGALSRYKGVIPRHGKVRQAWVARIKCQYRARDIGPFRYELSAAIAYNAAAHNSFGAFACMNPIDQR